jgi:hypothetical protein
MCHVMRMALVVVAAFQASAALSVATAQSSGGTLQACSLLSPAEFKQITGRTDILSRGPQAAEPDEVPEGVSECEFLGFSVSLVDKVNHERFETTRKQLAQSGNKIQPVSGVGDEAYLYEGTGQSYRQLAIVMRVGERRLAFMDLVDPDSVEAVKPVLLKLGKAAAPKLR